MKVGLLALLAFSPTCWLRPALAHETSDNVPPGFSVDSIGLLTATIRLKSIGVLSPGDACFDKFLLATRHAEALHNVAEANVDKTVSMLASEAERKRQEAVDELRRDYPMVNVTLNASRVMHSGEVEELKLRFKREGVLPNPRYMDAQLSEKGLEQTRRKLDVIAALKSVEKKDPQVVFASPLRRTLMTSKTIWQNKTVVGLDMLVEKRTLFPCDTRRALSEIRRTPPYTDAPRMFELLTDSREDIRRASLMNLRPPSAEAWPTTHAWHGLMDDSIARDSVKEDDETMQRYRSGELLKWVAGLRVDAHNTPLSSVAIVSHKGFLRELELAAGFYSRERKMVNLYGNAETRVYRLDCEAGNPSGFIV